jgi:hypothetical protein
MDAGGIIVSVSSVLGRPKGGRWCYYQSLARCEEQWLNSNVSLIDWLPKCFTAHGRAYLTLRSAEHFTIGCAGASGRISDCERAMMLLVNAEARGSLIELVRAGSLAGRLYALLGLTVLKDPSASIIIREYVGSSAQVVVSHGCFRSSQSVATVVCGIEEGTYQRLLGFG